MRYTLAIGALLAGGFTATAEEPLLPQQLEFFEKKIRPVLATQCYSCHSAGEGKNKGGLTLDTRDALRKGGDSGEVIIPGDPKNSLLIKAMHWDPKEGLEMPPKTKLDEGTVADFEAWILMGAPDPRKGKAASIKKVFWTQEQADNHWAYQPIVKPVPPAVKGNWARTPVDEFIRAKHEAAGLQPAKPADKRTLIRRAYIDLIGLPPTLAEVEAFEKDDAPEAFKKVINQLLARPEYGERWGRYWLDIARYADTSGDRAGGNRRDPRYPYAWTYRDYVIRAFNTDKPFNQFIREQIAADQLDLDDERDLAALGYLTVGKRFMNDVNEVIDDRIDVVGKGFMGLTLACARCHDHKFDPIPTADYYSLHGVFNSTRYRDELIEEIDEDDPQYIAYTKARQTAINGSREYGLRAYNQLLARFTKDSGKYLFEAQAGGFHMHGKAAGLADGQRHGPFARVVRGGKVHLIGGRGGDQMQPRFGDGLVEVNGEVHIGARKRGDAAAFLAHGGRFALGVIRKCEGFGKSLNKWPGHRLQGEPLGDRVAGTHAVPQGRTPHGNVCHKLATAVTGGVHKHLRCLDILGAHQLGLQQRRFLQLRAGHAHAQLQRVVLRHVRITGGRVQDGDLIARDSFDVGHRRQRAHQQCTYRRGSRRQAAYCGQENACGYGRDGAGLDQLWRHEALRLQPA